MAYSKPKGKSTVGIITPDLQRHDGGTYKLCHTCVCIRSCNKCDDQRKVVELHNLMARVVRYNGPVLADAQLARLNKTIIPLKPAHLDSAHLFTGY